MSAEIVKGFAVGFVLILGAATCAEAQEPATSIDQLRVLVRPGDAVSLTDTSGRQLTGAVSRLSESSLALRIGGREQTVQEADIVRIQQSRDDSLKNGARNGCVVGGLVGLLVGLAIAGDVPGGGYAVPSAILVYGGIGAGIGVGVDAMITTRQTIYDSTWKRPAPQLSFRLMSW